MEGFLMLLSYGTKRRMKDFFIIVYNVAYPLVLILILGYIATNFFKGDSAVTSSAYYTFVTVPYFVFASIITMAYVAKDESLSKTAYRFITAPVSGRSIVLSKIISCTFVVWVCTLIDMGVTMLALKVRPGNSIGWIIVLFLAEAFMASAIGIYLGMGFKSFEALKGILNIPISIFALLGGSFFPVGSLGSTFEKVSYISPLTWINKGIISAVYDKNFSLIINSSLIIFAIGLVFSISAVKSFKKEAFL